jgi:hypothetical protein
MNIKKGVVVGLLAATSTLSSVAGYFATTDQAGPPLGELEKLMTLISYDNPPGLTYAGGVGDPSVSYEASGIACLIEFITKDETERTQPYTLTDLGFLGGYDSIYAGVKYATSIDWYMFSPSDASVEFTTLTQQDISHITYFGLICEEEDTPGETVPDAGSMLVLLGGGLLGLAGIRRRLQR